MTNVKKDKNNIGIFIKNKCGINYNDFSNFTFLCNFKGNFILAFAINSLAPHE